MVTQSPFPCQLVYSFIFHEAGQTSERGQTVSPTSSTRKSKNSSGRLEGTNVSNNMASQHHNHNRNTNQVITSRVSEVKLPFLGERRPRGQQGNPPQQSEQGHGTSIPQRSTKLSDPGGTFCAEPRQSLWRRDLCLFP